MLISDYAALQENKSGFWVEKLYSESGKCSFLVHHQGLTEFRDFISEAKNNLRDRHKKKDAALKYLLENPIRRSPFIVRPQQFVYSHYIQGV